jgi:two-component system phosphate regulon sensor histidine kinase PhoR
MPPRWRLAVAALAGIAVQAALTVALESWSERNVSAVVAIGVLLAVLAGAFGGIWAALLVAAAGWTLHFVFVEEQSLRSLAALPAWLAAAGIAGWLATRLRRRADERALAAGELAAVGEAAGEAIVRVDAEGAIAGWSLGAERLYGYPGQEIEGRSLADLFGGEDGEQAERCVDAVRRGSQLVSEDVLLTRRDGRAFPASLSVAPIFTESGDPGGAVLVASDIGEQLRANDRLRESEAKYRSLTEHLPLATYVRPVDEPSSLLYVSPQIDRLLGYTADECLRDPELLARLVHPDDRDRVRREVAAGLEEAKPLDGEYRMVSRDGRTVWVHDRAAVVLDSRGSPLCVQGYLLDVSERKNAEAERNRLRSAEIAAAEEATDGQRKTDFVGEAAAVLASSLDYRATIKKVAALAVHDLADWCVVDVVEEDGSVKRLVTERAEPPSSLPEPAAEPEPEVLDVIRAQRHEVSTSRICVPLMSRGRRAVGALTLIAGGNGRTYTSHDLGWAHALAGMAALAIDNARLYGEVEARADATRVLTYVGDGVFLLDRAGIVRLWNPAAEGITGLPAAAVLGHPAAEAIPGWDEISERVPVAAAREPARAETFPIDTGRGERWISISGVEFFGGTVYAFRDITDAHRLDELQADFIATASHELRTPLAAVYGAAQTLRRHDFALDEAGRARFISLIVEESDRLARIVNQILLANQLDVGRLDLLTEPFDPVELVERVVEAARTHIPQHITLDVAAPKQLPAVAADRDRVRQILVNLVENAIKYSPDGGRIELGVAAENGMVLFRVSDEGLGIPADEQPRIFEKFYRLDPDMTRGIGGTGLGLYICSELVERMGGRIWVESDTGSGSTFFFDLPSAESPRALPRVREATAQG